MLYPLSYGDMTPVYRLRPTGWSLFCFRELREDRSNQPLVYR